jgi:hypothetical protein
MLEIILNGDVEGKVHFLVSEFITTDEVYIPIGIIKAKFEKNCYKKIVECILLHTDSDAIKHIELLDSDGLNFHIFDVTLVDKGEEEIRNYMFEIMPIF